MSAITIGIASVVFFLLLLLLGVHIGVSFIFTGILASSIIIGWNPMLSILGQTMYYSVATTGFVALPLFVLMGSFSARGGFAKGAYSALNKIIGNIPGSLAIATCYACAAFGAISGSALATAAVFGRIALPEMERYNYKKVLSLGSIAAAGTFADMIPPSTLFIVYAMFTDQSIGRLFLAGIIPGLITATVYAASIIIRVKKDPSLAPVDTLAPSITLKEKVVSLKGLGPIAIIATTVLGGIYSGIFTPTEAGAAGAFLALIMGMYMGKLNKIEKFKQALRESAQTTSLVFMIIIGSLVFSRVLSITQLPAILTMVIQSWTLPNYMILAGILMLWFFLGMIIIPVGIYAITLPIVFPIILKLGYDPIWFGVITLKMAEIAAVTPPVGLNVYSLYGVVASKGTTLEEVFSGIWPFVICDIVVLVFLIMFPQICLFLPNLLLGK